MWTVLADNALIQSTEGSFNFSRLNPKQELKEHLQKHKHSQKLKHLFSRVSPPPPPGNKLKNKKKGKSSPLCPHTTITARHQAKIQNKTKVLTDSFYLPLSPTANTKKTAHKHAVE